MAQLDYYFATISPFTYLTGERVEKIAAKHGLTVVYKPLDIMALFGRTGGVPPRDRHPSRQEYRLQELARQSKKTGLPLNLKPAHWPTNPAPSSYAIIAAQAAGGGDVGKLVNALTAACWAGEKDIAQDDVIRDCLSQAGFDPSLADSGLLSGAEAYARNLEDAVARGVFGAPFFITEDDQRFWGQDRLDDLEAHLDGRL
ncbi:putative 2-hydroxychromene-2-carboxylate isomerase [Dinoroseobacter shibae DFL 12 = DSM 16493]|jgi:2-hydroxychromene-2-carboxylate isomerase|uniref:2-hydroxychromene-2-carboxylate isomerase n=1 Tax=Dinoroseobacter shibae (strain DSM 16493 / NCIMB 14021 / DFL 12) TaxID=398580 RepID=A8LJR0_DINSH|nr:2-hydroxychromene-2-carboxylate isomerase [Dinoroseobacter shibae]ABV94663.1 putative 2-hydroxychromene-2-carboxylate isomerase [Dinoroseobacter shibae DFL 12 = DSM 16493]URF46086.1 2-hydroxychromene-2-carboxylate isomerase [Dinoroseobacter shibae]URF50393.1 2-hydroxychromene-2-carboxylate isomerase [Dinoroseobacter shibae]